MKEFCTSELGLLLSIWLQLIYVHCKMIKIKKQVKSLESRIDILCKNIKEGAFKS